MWKGEARGKTFDSRTLVMKESIDWPLCILAHNDKWVCNFPPDWGATKHISTFPGGSESTVFLCGALHVLLTLAALTVQIDNYARCDLSRHNDFTQWGNLLMKKGKACFSCLILLRTTQYERIVHRSCEISCSFSFSFCIIYWHESVSFKWFASTSSLHFIY